MNVKAVVLFLVVGACSSARDGALLEPPSRAGDDDASSATEAGAASDGPAPPSSMIDGSSDGAAPTDATDADQAGAPGIFVAVGYGGRRLHSSDGTAWTDDQHDIANGGDDTYLLRDVGAGGGAFVAVGWRIKRSADARTWTDAAQMNQWLGGIAYANGLWVAAGGYGRNSWSDDGVTWHDVDDPHTDAFRALAHGGGHWVAVGDNGRRRYTGDGKSWSDGAGDVTFGMGDVAFGNGTFAAIGGSEVATSSDGGATWTARGPLLAGAEGIAFGAGHFVAVGGGRAWKSSDGVAWSEIANAKTSGAIAYGAGTFVAIDGGGHVHRSTDASTWTHAALASADTNAIVRVRWLSP